MSVTQTNTKQFGLLGDTQRNVQRSNIDNVVRRWCLINIGATGAPTVAPAAVTAITVTRTGAGTYNVTFPAQLSTATCYVRAYVVLSAATTVAQATITAFSQTAGTATFVTALNAAGTAVDPANGDILMLEVVSDDLNG